MTAARYVAVCGPGAEHAGPAALADAEAAGRELAQAGVIVAIRGGWGTLSEVAAALKSGTPVVGVGGWQGLDGVELAPDGATRRAMELIRASG